MNHLLKSVAVNCSFAGQLRKRKFHIKMAKYALKTSTCEREKTEETKKHSCEEKLKKKPVGEVKYSCSGDVSAPRVLWWAFELGIEQDNEQDIDLDIGQDIEQDIEQDIYLDIGQDIEQDIYLGI